MWPKKITSKYVYVGVDLQLDLPEDEDSVNWRDKLFGNVHTPVIHRMGIPVQYIFIQN